MAKLKLYFHWGKPSQISQYSGLVSRLFHLNSLVVIVALGMTGFSSPGFSEPHIGEDGIEYPDSGGIIDKSSWVKGKIDPAVTAKAATADTLDVVIYLRAPAQAVAPTPQDIKVRHQPVIDNLGQQIRAIVKSYRPDWSMTEVEEEHYTDVYNMMLSDTDHDRLQDLKTRLDEARDTMRREVADAIAKQVQGQQKAVEAFITAKGGTVRHRLPVANAIAASISPALLDILADHPLVTLINDDPPEQLLLDVSVPSLQYNAWWNDATPITGTPYDLGVVDHGVEETHPAFSCVNAWYKPAGSIIQSDHGTHVAGIAVSCDSTYQGGVLDVDAVIWANTSGSSSNQSPTMVNMDWMVTTPLQKPEVINHSLGYGTANDVDYSANDSFYDALVDGFDVMVSNAAGNEYWTTTDPGDSAITLTYPSPAFNLIVVANMDDQNTTSRADDVRRASSSVGPTVGGRKKPDITAPGTNIMSTNSDWATEVDFISKSGTSMAAPHVSAAIVLMEDGGNQVPMAQKAVLLNTADAWTSNDTETTTDDGEVTGSHWDKSYGWGYLDMWEAHFNRADYFTASVVPNNDTATDDDYKLYKGTMFTNEKATMVWEKRADTYVAGAPSTGQRSLADLNLRLYNEADGSLVSSDLDGNDNVHQVAANATITGVIKAYAWSASFDGATSETFALATEENFAAVTPPSFSRNYSRPNYVGPYDTFDLTARVFNNGGVGAHNVNMNVSNIAGVSGAGNINLGTIASDGGVQEHVYTLTTTNMPAGTHWLPMDVSSNSYLETYTYNTTLGVSIVVDATPPTSSCTSPVYENGVVAVSFTASDAQSGMLTDSANSFLYVKRPGDANFLYTGLSAGVGTSGTINYTPSSIDGSYQFAIRSRDAVGNIEPIPTVAECSTFVDSVTPVSTLSTPSLDLNTTVPLTYSVTDASPSSGLEFVDFWYRKEGGTWAYTGLFSTTIWSGVMNFVVPDGDGTYYFYSRAKDNAQNIEPNASGTGKSTTVVDTQPPTGTIQIESGAAVTNSLLVSLDLSATDAGTGVTLMRFSNNGSTWAPWESYSAIRTNWDLSAYGGDTSSGIKAVYVQFRDGAGRVSVTEKDTIEYQDPLAPSITGIWPASGTPGDFISVFVFGDNFLSGGTPAVYFNGVRQYIVATVSDEMLIVRINVDPSLYGPVTVITSHGTAVSGTSFGVPTTGLQLTGVWPGQANNGESLSVFLFGNEFTTDGSTEVYFNGVRQYVVAAVSSEMLIVRLTANPALSGLVTVVTPAGSVTSSEPFVVLP